MNAILLQHQLQYDSASSPAVSSTDTSILANLLPSLMEVSSTTGNQVADFADIGGRCESSAVILGAVTSTNKWLAH
jgi:hypothetical protein